MAHINFSWSVPTEHMDGTPLTDPLIYTLYEDGVNIVSDILEPSFSLLMQGKDLRTYQYTVTATSTSTGLESPQSVPVLVSFTLPKSPANLLYSFSE